MRVLCVGIDGADYDLVRDLLAQGRLPTLARLAREGTFGPLRSTVPAVTPTAWSSFLTGLNPGAHGIFNFTANPNRTVERLESAATRAGTPLWRVLGAAGIRSAFVMIPFTYPPEPIDGILVSGYGGPARPAVEPVAARERIASAFPDLITAHHPMAERWWEDFPRFTGKLLAHVDEVAGVCRLCLESEPDLRFLAVDFMSSDFAGHLGWNRLDPGHPAHDPAAAGDELVQVYEAVDRACGELVEATERAWGEEATVVVISDHGMKPIYWVFHLNDWLARAGYLRFRRRSLQPLRGGKLDRVARVDQRLVRTKRWYGSALDRLPLPPPDANRAFADIDFGRTRAYGYGTLGQIYLGEATRARDDPAVEREIVDALASIRHPESGEPAFDVKRKEELYRGPFLEKAPELVLLPRDERVFVEASRRSWDDPFERRERLDPEAFYGYSGHHAPNGVIAAAGPGIRTADVPEGAEITQLAATLLGLFGLAAELDGAPIDAILDVEPERAVAARAARGGETRVYSEDEEARMIERLRDLGYE